MDTSSSLTRTVAEWAAGVRLSDIPSSVLERARLQVASVLGAVFAGASGDVAPKVRRAAARWGSGEDASLIPTGERVPLHTACYVNAAASIAFDYDDYLFAGHTGHSAVLGALAFGEAAGAAGADVVAAQVVANEVGGRLGAALLLGPHNGQMWTYIHAIEGACIAGRFLGLDAAALADAIGIALAQPPYPLAPAFFGPDSKTLLASGPLVEGIRAAELAAEGLTGAADILGDPNGMLAKIGARPLPFVFGGLGSAWVTSSLAYKLYPGCAYVDTPVDAFDEIREAFAAKTGRPLASGDVKSVRVEATLFTAGMEALATPYRSRDRITPIDVNFSVGMSFGVMLACGEISGETLSARSLAEHRDEILSVADRVTVEQAGDLTMDVGGLSDLGIDPAKMFAGDRSLSMDGVDFSKFEMRFPARVAMETTTGEEFTAEVRIPAGAPGRPFDETTAAVASKFLRGARTWLRDPEGALEAVLAIDTSPDVRGIVERIVAR